MAFAIRVEHRAFWPNRIRRAFLESVARRGNEFHSFLFRAAPLQRTGRLLDSDRTQRHSDFQRRQFCHDDRSALDLLLGGGDATRSGSRWKKVRDSPGGGR